MAFVRGIGYMPTKKDISENGIYTTWKLFTVLANVWNIDRKPKHYSINSPIVNNDDRKIGDFNHNQRSAL